jgi:hypothetical protein
MSSSQSKQEIHTNTGEEIPLRDGHGDVEQTGQTFCSQL